MAYTLSLTEAIGIAARMITEQMRVIYVYRKGEQYWISADNWRDAPECTIAAIASKLPHNEVQIEFTDGRETEVLYT